MNREFLRLLVTATFAFGVLILYQRWTEFSQPPTEVASTPSAVHQATQVSPADNAVPQVTQELVASSEGGSTVPSLANEQLAPTTVSGEIVATIANDAVAAGFDQQGNLVQLQLLRHTVEQDGEPLPLLVSNNNNLYIAQSGLIGAGLPTHEDPGWRTQVAASQANVVTSTWADGTLQVERKYILAEQGYLGRVEYVLTNTGTENVTGHAYFQFLRDRKPPASYSALVPSYFGAAIYTNEDKYSKYSFDDLEDYPKRTSDGWIGIVERYFMGVWLDGGSQRENYMNPAANDNVRIGIIRSVAPVAPNASVTLTQPFFLGALEQNLLNELDQDIAPNISLAVDYGWLSWACRPLFWVLGKIHQGIGNWGVAIILLTVLIKLLLYPLTNVSYRSMAKLKTFAPQMQKLKERHGEDKQALQQAMIELYRKEKINPMGGCLPILVQIPIFIALYWMLLESVELRHAPLGGWLTDLSAPDPYYILPVILGLAMFGQFKLNPTPPDPTQAMIMKIMPIGFAGFSIFFPSGLVVYWITNTVLSVAQQWHITRNLEQATKKRN